jgi:hypothetical protein
MRHGEATKKRVIYRQRVKDGLCVQCGKVPPREGKRACAECAKSQSKRESKYQKRINTALMYLRVCIHCKEREVMQGRRVCGVCIEIQIEQQRIRRNRWKDAGLCQRCGSERDREDRAYCTACRTAHNRHGAKSKERARKQKRIVSHPEAA